MPDGLVSFQCLSQSISMILMQNKDENGVLNVKASPNPSKINEMARQRLAVIKLGKGALAFWSGWSAEQMSIWFKELFPDAFDYLATHPYKANPSALPWALLIKSQRTHSLAFEPLPGGYEVAHYARKDGKSCEKRVVYISKFSILDSIGSCTHCIY